MRIRLLAICGNSFDLPVIAMKYNLLERFFKAKVISGGTVPILSKQHYPYKWRNDIQNRMLISTKEYIEQRFSHRTLRDTNGNQLLFGKTIICNHTK